jgi:hypothetical protein
VPLTGQLPGVLRVGLRPQHFCRRHVYCAPPIMYGGPHRLLTTLQNATIQRTQRMHNLRSLFMRIEATKAGHIA